MLLCFLFCVFFGVDAILPEVYYVCSKYAREANDTVFPLGRQPLRNMYSPHEKLLVMY